MLLKWPDVLRLAKEGNPPPDRKVIKTETECRQQLSPEEYHVTRQACTEYGASPFGYLTELLQHAEELERNPSEWMPWNYRETLARLTRAAAA